MRERAADGGRFICCLLALWLCIPVSIAAVGALPIDDGVRDTLVPLLLVLLAWPIAGIMSFFWVVQLLNARRWLRAALALTLPAFITLSWFTPGAAFSDPLFQPAYRVNRFVHFVSVKRIYDREVPTLRGPEPPLKLFVWESDPIGGSGIVYDSSDDIALPKNRRPKNWAQRATTYRGALEELCSIEAVGSHYYIVSFGCYKDPK